MLKEWRAHHRFSQAEAAINLGVPLRTLQGWEAGRPMAYPALLQQPVDILSRASDEFGGFLQSQFPREFASFIDFVGADRIDKAVAKVARKLGALSIRDRDRIFGNIVTRRLRAMGIRDAPTAPASSWQNGFAERLIGSIRRECVDHIIVLGEAHLRRILRSYARYYNDIRTHWSLSKDAPVSRPVQRTGSIRSHALLGGLHHHYVRV